MNLYWNQTVSWYTRRFGGVLTRVFERRSCATSWLRRVDFRRPARQSSAASHATGRCHPRRDGKNRVARTTSSSRARCVSDCSNTRKIAQRRHGKHQIAIIFAACTVCLEGVLSHGHCDCSCCRLILHRRSSSRAGAEEAARESGGCDHEGRLPHVESKGEEMRDPV
jgi:hypothetical protein